MKGRFHIHVFLALALTGCLVNEVSSVEVGSGGNDSNSWVSSTTQNVLISLSVLCTLVLVVFGCTWVWWRRVFCFWRKTGTFEAPPDWFVPYATPAGGNPPFATLDPSNLSRDINGRGGRTSVTIEALPTLHDLGMNGRDSFELRTFPTPSIVPTSSSLLSLHNPDYNQGSEIQHWFKPEASFPRKSLEYQQIIGKGWFGKVLETEAINIKQYVRSSNVVVRELRNNATEQDQVRFLSEARIYREAQEQRCDNVLKLLGYCVDQLPYILIFEYFPLGDLKSYLKMKAKQEPGQLKAGDDGMLTRMIVDIIRGVKWMEQVGFAHGDLAARNCLVANPNGKVIIGDYGYSAQKFKADYHWSSSAGCAIPIRWAAPETIGIEEQETEGPTTSANMNNRCVNLKTLEITNAANIWTLAVVIWEVFQRGKTPYDNLSDEDVIRQVIRQNRLILEPPQLPFVKSETKEKIYQLLVSCWNTVPNHRPSIDTIEQLFTTPN